ncbi:MAG: class I SAM-dependent methyltransferase [Rhodothermales bacterium]
MTAHHADKIFSGSIPAFYETYLVPLIFEPYAHDLAQRVRSEPASRVLELAAGTGVVTRALVDSLDPTVSIVATDLNQAMLDYGASVRNDANVTWQRADALALPFEEGTFDAVVCQFAVMFFPDRVRAYAEALRVLKPGGRFLFNVWDHLRENEFADTVTKSLESVFPADPPRFLARTPHGYWDLDEIASDLSAGGFTDAANVETIAARSKASHPSIPAIAYCQGTPLRHEIERRDSSLLGHATAVATAAVSARFGDGTVDGKIQGHIVSTRA